MQLIIDLGNSRIKYFVFHRDREIDSITVSLEEWKNALNHIQTEHPSLKKCIISDVNGIITNDLKSSLYPIQIIFCSTKLNLPFKTRYQPAKDLGSDRIGLLAACAIEYPKQNTLIIDLGSCITYDFLDIKGIHHGGAISPGFTMRYKAMNSFSGRLPLLKPKSGTTFLGTNTESGIHAGVSMGIFAEINEAINYYEENFKFLNVILTGGDAQRLPKPLKNSIFANTNFLAKGLNFILSSN